MSVFCAIYLTNGTHFLSQPVYMLVPMGNIQLYVNELILGNNTTLLNLDGKMTSMITYSVFNYLMTQDERFSARAFETFNTLLSRSTLVSRVGEKDRNRFFNTLRDKVNKLRDE